MRVAPENPQLDRGHPLAEGLCGVWLPVGPGWFQEFVQGLHITPTGAIPPMVVGEAGRGVDCGGTAYDHLESQGGKLARWPVQEMTLVGVFTFRAAVSGRYAQAFGRDGSVNNRGFSWLPNYGSASECRLIVNIGGSRRDYTFPLWPVDRTVVVAVTRSADNSMSQWVDGVPSGAGSAGHSGDIQAPTTDDLLIGGLGGGFDPGDYDHHGVALYDRALTVDEIRRLAVDPFQMLRPRRRVGAAAAPPADPDPSTFLKNQPNSLLRM